jgi:hypothetical protein
MWLLLGADLIIMPGILLLKAAVLALVWYFMREYGSRRLYYFSNLGMAPRALWGWSIALDLAIFAISMVAALTYKILWA